MEINDLINKVNVNDKDISKNNKESKSNKSYADIANKNYVKTILLDEDNNKEIQDTNNLYLDKAKFNNYNNTKKFENMKDIPKEYIIKAKKYIKSINQNDKMVKDSNNAISEENYNEKKRINIENKKFNSYKRNKR